MLSYVFKDYKQLEHFIKSKKLKHKRLLSKNQQSLVYIVYIVYIIF